MLKYVVAHCFSDCVPCRYGPSYRKGKGVYMFGSGLSTRRTYRAGAADVSLTLEAFQVQMSLPTSVRRTTCNASSGLTRLACSMPMGRAGI